MLLASSGVRQACGACANNHSSIIACNIINALSMGVSPATLKEHVAATTICDRLCGLVPQLPWADPLVCLEQVFPYPPTS